MNAFITPLAALALACAAPAAPLHAAPLPAPGVDFGIRFDWCGPQLRLHPSLRLDLGGRCRPIHRHCYAVVREREWVAPLWQDCVVGRDPCGRPIVRPTLVRAGYWTTVEYRVCGCGHRLRC
ncbi:MAG: hypothetical protein FJ293_14535 [Planctomycetes bacterium]|nr:hypothetical protein [Planctomycetota bacterium]